MNVTCIVCKERKPWLDLYDINLIVEARDIHNHTICIECFSHTFDRGEAFNWHGRVILRCDDCGDIIIHSEDTCYIAIQRAPTFTLNNHIVDKQFFHYHEKCFKDLCSEQFIRDCMPALLL
jgi:hypothetical protein